MGGNVLVTRPQKEGLRCVALAMAVLLVSAASATAQDGVRGPVPWRILSPVHLLFYHLPPESAESLEKDAVSLQVDVSESNAIHPPEDLPFTFRSQVDLELTRLALTYRRGLTDRWDLGVEVPFYYVFGGFLDETIAETERLFDALKPRRRNEDRENRQDEFAYRLFVGDQLVVEGRDHAVELGDLAIFAKRTFREQDGTLPALALRVGLKAPTGDPGRGMGSGEVDAVAGVAASWNLDRWSAHAGGQVILPVKDFQDVPGLTALPQLSLYVDGAYSRWRKLALHAQLAVVSPAFETDHDLAAGGLRPGGRPPGGDNTFEGHVLQVTPALSWRFEEDRTLFLGIAEDFGSSEDTAFDVTLFASFRWRVGGSSD